MSNEHRDWEIEMSRRWKRNQSNESSGRKRKIWENVENLVQALSSYFNAINFEHFVVDCQQASALCQASCYQAGYENSRHLQKKERKGERKYELSTVSWTHGRRDGSNICHQDSFPRESGRKFFHQPFRVFSLSRRVILPGCRIKLKITFFFTPEGCHFCSRGWKFFRGKTRDRDSEKF